MREEECMSIYLLIKRYLCAAMVWAAILLGVAVREGGGLAKN